MKKRLFGIILCVSLLLSSMSVFAGSATKWFDGNVAHLTASNGYLTASTEANEQGTVTTRVVGYGPYDEPLWGYGSYYVRIDSPKACTSADSYHYVGANSTYLTVLYG